MMAHDFVRFPELTNSEMQFYYFESPHRQIFEDFDCQCMKVHDGDTISVKWAERDFIFPVRFSNIAAPELNEGGGREAQSWLENRLLGKNITVKVDPRNRVEKWGRLLGQIICDGIDIGQEEVALGLSTTWQDRHASRLPNLDKMIPALVL